jgi:hypothetical protein
MMTETGKLILKLTVLIVPTAIVLFTLYGGPKGNGGGGGGYDLSELVYSGFVNCFYFRLEHLGAGGIVHRQNPGSEAEQPTIALYCNNSTYCCCRFGFSNSYGNARAV